MEEEAGAPPDRSGSTARRQRAIEAIDAANSDDPNRIVVDGVEVPKELAHAELMTRWVEALDPSADDAQIVAARAHHVRRWEVPRSTYPAGRSGYLRWRAGLRRRHADIVAGILAGAGYDGVFIERVQRIVRKEGLGRDPAVQTHEDALCLVFLQTQLDGLIDQLGEAPTVEVVRKTAAKMSEAALSRAGGLELSERGGGVVQRALASSA